MKRKNSANLLTIIMAYYRNKRLKEMVNCVLGMDQDDQFITLGLIKNAVKKEHVSL